MPATPFLLDKQQKEKEGGIKKKKKDQVNKAEN